MNKDKFALNEIRNIVKNMRGTIYSDSDIIDTIKDYIDNYFLVRTKATSWNLMHNDEFQKDVKTDMSAPMLAIKYNCSLQAIYYHRRKVKK